MWFEITKVDVWVGEVEDGPGALAEVGGYASQLKSVTGGQGSYMMELSHYDVVPPNVQQQIVAQYKAKEDEDE